MAIFVDELRDTAVFTSASTPQCFRNARSCHLFSDEPGARGREELHDFAKRLHLRPSWLQNGGTDREHYDLTPGRRKAAVAIGAKECTWREMGRIVKLKKLKAELDFDSLGLM